MRPQTVIAAKRDGCELGRDDLNGFIRGFLDEEVTDYQMSAFLMAVTLRGMTPRETADLTRVMIDTGNILSFPDISGIKVDKHSTGGVGDLVSLPLAPLVAACGVPVPMISGRGLGHTGGTLDKLESIAGLRTDLTPQEFSRILGKVGFVMGGQTADLAPADRRMYALRDVTGTVESIPLIVSSILSKKVAEGIDALVLDVKCGRGAFMATEGEALELAHELTRVGALLGKQVVAFVTDMDLPLGNALGNAVEVRAALDCLDGRGPGDLMEIVLILGGAMLGLGKPGSTWQNNQDALAAALADGNGRRRFRDMVESQGGDVGMVDDPTRLPRAPLEIPVVAENGGYLTDVNPRRLGEAVVDLGGGRRHAGDTVDPGVGVLLHRKVGDAVDKGDVLATVLASREVPGRAIAKEAVAPSFRIGQEPPPLRERVRSLVTVNGSRPWAGGRSWSEDVVVQPDGS